MNAGASNSSLPIITANKPLIKSIFSLLIPRSVTESWNQRSLYNSIELI